MIHPTFPLAKDYKLSCHSIFLVKDDMYGVSQEGFEPSAYGFTVRRSTN